MKVAFFSNYLNHHQLPFCLAMLELTQGAFTFVASGQVSQERLNLGYADMNAQYPFVLRSYESEEAESRAMELARDCDLMIIGSAPERYFQERVKHNKPVFRYAEREFKKDYRALFSPRAQYRYYQKHTRYGKAPVYMLCASAYTAPDYALFGAYKGKTYKFGYFPDVKAQETESLFANKQNKQKPLLLWVGRLIDWKHPEKAVWVAQQLKSEGYDFQMKIVGTGPMEQALCKQIADRQLQDFVQMTGAMPPEQVRSVMEQADVFLFTSDRNEGWGAVLNEAMNSGCAVVANEAIGSAPFLIENGKNGLRYKNPEELLKNVRLLLDNPELQRQLGEVAYRTLESTWNAREAARRLLELDAWLRAGKNGSPFVEGPCSKTN